MHTRPTQDTDYPVLALLHNATQEPHFHTTAVRLKKADERSDPSSPPRLVLEHAGEVIGFGPLWLPEFDAGRAWIGLHLHPDHLDSAAGCLLAALVERLPDGISRLWSSVRADYASASPDLAAFSVHVHLPRPVRTVAQVAGGAVGLLLMQVQGGLAAQGADLKLHGLILAQRWAGLEQLVVRMVVEPGGRHGHTS